MVNTLFKIINVSIIIGIIAYIGRRFGVPFLTKIKEDDQKYVEDLKHEHNELVRAHQEVKNSIDDQEQQCIFLSKKIDTWSINREKELQKEEQKREILSTRARDRRLFQNEYYSKYCIKHAVQERVLKQLEVELREYFSDVMHAHKYINNSISSIEKK